MPNVAIEKDEVKKLLKVAKKRPLSFAVAPGKTDDDFLFALHRKHQAAMLGKSLKKESTGNKVAFGLCAVDGTLVTLTCEQELPNLAKRLKKWLKKQGVSYNVRILDADGNVIEDDIEDLPDAPDDDEDPDDDDLFEDDANDKASADPRIAKLRKVLLGFVPEIRALTPPNPKLQSALKMGLEKINEGDFETAAKLATMIQSELKKAQAQPTETPSQDLRALAAQLKDLRPKCMAADPPANEALMKAWDMAANQIKGQDADAAAKTIKAIEGKLSNLTPAVTDPLQVQWETVWAKLSPQVLEAVNANVPNAQSLRAAMGMADEAAATGDYKKALAVAKRLAAALQQAKTAKAEEAPADAVDKIDFRQTRLLWAQARDSLRGEMKKVADAIVTACKNVDGVEDIQGAMPDLFAYLDPIDEQLHDALDNLIETTEPAARDTQKKACLKVIDSYLNTLNSGIFLEIDDANGFVSGVKVRENAVTALGEVAKALQTKEAA